MKPPRDLRLMGLGQTYVLGLYRVYRVKVRVRVTRCPGGGREAWPPLGPAALRRPPAHGRPTPAVFRFPPTPPRPQAYSRCCFVHRDRMIRCDCDDPLGKAVLTAVFRYKKQKRIKEN